MQNKQNVDSTYLQFGASDAAEFAAAFDCKGTLEYLLQFGIGPSALTQARRPEPGEMLKPAYVSDDVRYCDFCARGLSGAEYDVLKDGRDRCCACSKTVVSKKQDFEALFFQVRDGLKTKFGIDLPQEMTVKVVSQAKLAKMVGTKFVPTKYFDPRTVGLATEKRVRGGDPKYGIVFENGTPRMSLIATAAHELTHIWQYSHWDWAAMQAKYGNKFLAVCEGMAKWAEIQYLFLLNETEQARRFLENEVARDDVYGYGLRLFLNEYPLSEGICLKGKTPFQNVNEPLPLR